MKKINKILWQRSFWYIAGFFLFFSPFAFYQKFLCHIFNLPDYPNIHNPCLRIPLSGLLLNDFTRVGVLAVFSFLLLTVAAFFLGPFFCGRLCTTGALPEYLSRLFPSKWQIDWSKVTNPVPIRYGFLFGFMISPFFAGSLACSFCNFYFLERFFGFAYTGEWGVLFSTTILTGFFWLILFGILAKGGRGFCSFFCPIGAWQSLFHSLGARCSFTKKIRFQTEKCIDCGLCSKNCPMGALAEDLNYNIHLCLTCGICTKICPTNALTYGTGEKFTNKQVIDNGKEC